MEHEEVKGQIQDIYHWLRDAKPGEIYVYATAISALTDNFKTFKLGREVWQLAVDGRIYLVQRRLIKPPYGVFDYIAIKASNPPVKKLVTLDYGDKRERGTGKYMPGVRKNARVDRTESVNV